MPARNGAFTNERTSRLSHNANHLFISHNIIRARGADASPRRDVAPPPYIVHNPSEVGAGFMPARNGAFTNERTSRLSHNANHLFISHNIIRARGADASPRRDVAPPPYIVLNPSEVGAGFMPARSGALTNERTSRLSHNANHLRSRFNISSSAASGAEVSRLPQGVYEKSVERKSPGFHKAFMENMPPIS